MSCTYGFRRYGKNYIWGNFTKGSPREFGNDRMNDLKERIRYDSVKEWKELLEMLKEDEDAENPNRIDTMQILMSGGTPISCATETKKRSTLDFALSCGYYQSGEVDGLDYSYVIDFDKEMFIVGSSREETIAEIKFAEVLKIETNLADYIYKRIEVNIDDDMYESCEEEEDESIIGKRKRELYSDFTLQEGEKPAKKQKLD